ncbi:hypothetical protein BT96DRAFT_981747 [Gymnopus androsaceus JB14]|uniref:Uncharacterized protein n=1 Tax=Gymnopus androsaceus JB14 TaxID=1447944 RepID=A0A6A4GM53_9AGAR|nr:hypothetical protein BT96DRAFT_981747 [Gymnopus androsaceus JB14]
MASNGAIPPPIPEVSADLKFDGGVRISWTPAKRRIVNSLKTQGLVGYTDGTTPRPAPIVVVTPPTGTTAVPAPPAPAASQIATPVFSTNPTVDEWVFRNDRAKGVIESHIDDLPSLIPDSDSKNAKELFEALETTFGGKDEMQKVLTMRRLRSYVFTGSDSIEAFFKRIRDLRKECIEAGNMMDDDTFREIVLAAFPGAEFDTIIQNITSSKNYPTSASVIQQNRVPVRSH